MAIGDQTDIYNRLIAQLPPWFETPTVDLAAALQMYVGYNANPNLITTMLFHYMQYQYAQLQMRIQTATGSNLDIISQDYLGNTLPRYPNENDDSFRQRILSNVVRPRATRQAMSDSVELLTGFTPTIIEGMWGPDHGYLNQPTTLGCNIYGSVGSGSYPYQFWIYAYLSPFQAMGNYPGLNLISFPSALTIASGGSGYVVNDTITLAGGNIYVSMVLTVTSVSGGTVTGFSTATQGYWNEPLPSNPLTQASTSGSGTGATFNVTSWNAVNPYFYLNTYGWCGGESLETANITADDVAQLVQNTKVLATLQHLTVIYNPI
ncbi:MAG TPA: hypothetical protein VGW78_07525 [Candidatus Babeliales bacterium]|jgi:hypothetical protein|nr:hypothetical protein [Candidatus Babeliales bacterium]